MTTTEKFVQGMRNFIDLRLDVVMERLNRDPHFIELNKEKRRFFKEYISHRIPSEEYDLYEDMESIEFGMFLYETYIQGLKDGFMLAKLLFGNDTLQTFSKSDLREEVIT